MTYETGDQIARITLDRPKRGNAITQEMPRELAACVERANLVPDGHVIALAGNGSGFCGGYDLVESAEGMGLDREQMPSASSASPAGAAGSPKGSPIDPMVMGRNHDPAGQWDPVT